MNDNYQTRADIARAWDARTSQAEREQIAQKQAAMSAACADASLIMGRAQSAIGIAQGPVFSPECVNVLNPHTHQFNPFPQVHIGPAGDIQLPEGEAFARATVLALIQQAANVAVTRDRQRNPQAGWTLKQGAKRAFIDMVNEVLTAQHVPADAHIAILAECVAALDRWAEV